MGQVIPGPPFSARWPGADVTPAYFLGVLGTGFNAIPDTQRAASTSAKNSHRGACSKIRAMNRELPMSVREIA